MQITWYGASCFSIAAKSATIVTNPVSPRLSAELVTISDDTFQPAATGMKGVVQVVDWPGEVERLGVFIIGQAAHAATAEVPAPHTIYSIEAEGITIGHLDGLSTKLTTEQVERLGDVDVLLIPVGGGALEPSLAKDVAEQIEPRLLIPMGDDADAAQKFLTLMGMEPERLDTIKLERRDLPEESMRLVVLAPQAA